MLLRGSAPLDSPPAPLSLGHYAFSFYRICFATEYIFHRMFYNLRPDKKIFTVKFIERVFNTCPSVSVFAQHSNLYTFLTVCLSVWISERHAFQNGWTNRRAFEAVRYSKHPNKLNFGMIIFLSYLFRVLLKTDTYVIWWNRLKSRECEVSIKCFD